MPHISSGNPATEDRDPMRQDLSCLLEARADTVDSVKSRNAPAVSHHSYALSNQSLRAMVCRHTHPWIHANITQTQPGTLTCRCIDT